MSLLFSKPWVQLHADTVMCSAAVLQSLCMPASFQTCGQFLISNFQCLWTLLAVELLALLQCHSRTPGQASVPVL